MSSQRAPTVRLTHQPIVDYVGADKAEWRRLKSNLPIPSIVADMSSVCDLQVRRVELILNYGRCVASLYSNRPELLDLLQQHLALANQGQTLPESVPAAEMTLFYLVDFEIDWDGEMLRASGSHYEGAVSSDNSVFVVAGAPTLGVLKSVVFGCWSSRFLLDGWYPAHCSALVAPNGQAVAFFGRGNWGKTTSLLACLGELAVRGFRALTDDWALINEHGAMRCFDTVMAIRPQVVTGIRASLSTEWSETVFRRFSEWGYFDSKKPHLPLNGALGPDSVACEANLSGCVVLRSEQGQEWSFRDSYPDDRATSGSEIARFAYHCPEAAGVSDRHNVSAFYDGLLEKTALSFLNCRVPDGERGVQLKSLCAWVIQVTSDG